MSETIQAGDLITHDPSAVLVYTSDWDEQNLPAGVELADAGTFSVEPDDGNVTIDEESLVTGNRKVLFRLQCAAAARGRRYRVHHQITTDETPAQTKEQSFWVLFQDR